MATKTYILNLLLILTSFQILAKSDEQQLSEWTKENEKKLKDTYPIIQSQWFEDECLALAELMNFNQMKQCHLFDSENINAFVFDNGHVYFSTSIMALIYNKHQWASILAHENAHIQLQHYLKTLKKIKKPGFFFPKKRIKKLIKQHELEADTWSEKKLIEYNFDTSQIVYFFKRVKVIQGESRTSAHLKLSNRIKPTKLKEIIDLDLTTAIKKISNLAYSN